MADVTDLTSGSGQVRESSLILALGYVRLGRVVWITICSGDGPDKIDPGNNGSITNPPSQDRSCRVSLSNVILTERVESP